MAPPRRRNLASLEGRAATDPAVNQHQEDTSVVPPLSPLLGGRVEHIPQTDTATSNPIIAEVNPQVQMMEMMRTMSETMVKQQELFTKMLADRDVNHRLRETTAENVGVGGSGRNENEGHTEGLVGSETRQAGRACTFKDFIGCKPPEFVGADNPVVCMNWIREIEQAFRACDCGENQKVRFGSHMLRGATLNWWNVLTSTLEASVLTQMTWQSFKKKLLEEYCSERDMDLIEEEFRSLKKGKRTVREYTQLFMEKLSLVGHVASTEKDKMKAYLKGLPADMMAMVHNSRATNLREMIEEAKMMERVYAQDKEEKSKVGEKRKWESPRDSDNKQRYQIPSRTVDSSREVEWCSKCKSKHFGQCRSPQLSCFKCGEVGHISFECPFKGRVCFECKEAGHMKYDCPKLKGDGAVNQSKKEAIPRARGRAYQMVSEETKGAADVVPGTFPLIS